MTAHTKNKYKQYVNVIPASPDQLNPTEYSAMSIKAIIVTEIGNVKHMSTTAIPQAAPNKPE